MSNSNIMNGSPQAQMGYALQAPAPVTGVEQACSGTQGCKRLVPVDNVAAKRLTEFIAAANAGLPELQKAANNSGKHYLEGEEMSKAALNDVNRLASEGIGPMDGK